MKFIKLLVVVFSIFMVNQISGQESEIKPQTKKKMKWMDKDKSGDISFEEMKNFYADKKNKNGTPIQYGRFFLGLDSNEDQKVSLEELNQKVNWNLAKQKLSKMSKEEASKYKIE